MIMTTQPGYYVVDTYETRPEIPQYTRMAHSGVYFWCITDIKEAVRTTLNPDRGLQEDFICKSALDEKFLTLLARKKAFSDTIPDSRPKLFGKGDIVFVGKGWRVIPRKAA